MVPKSTLSMGKTTLAGGFFPGWNLIILHLDGVSWWPLQQHGLMMHKRKEPL